MLGYFRQLMVIPNLENILRAGLLGAYPTCILLDFGFPPVQYGGYPLVGHLDRAGNLPPPVKVDGLWRGGGDGLQQLSLPHRVEGHDEVPVRLAPLLARYRV